jgi:hypothetical protein
MAKARRAQRTADDARQHKVMGSQTAADRGPAMRYEPSSKHKEPWQRGARGSLCPKDANGPALLAVSEIDPEHQGKRYATDGTRAYCGHEHMPGRWHGFPVEWRAVPAKIRNAWLADGQVSKRAIREHW